MNKQLRIIFMGTPEFAVESLNALVEGGYNVVAVITQPDKPVGRHASQLQPSPVKQYALAHGLPLLQPEKMKDPLFLETLRALKADLQVVVAFRMLPEVVWNMPRFGTFNVHAALLPKYRGAAPINWAIINGETTTGVTTFFLDHDIDTGRIIESREFPIPDNADLEYVYDGLMHLGATICLSTVDKVIAMGAEVPSIAQPDNTEGLPVAPKLHKENTRICWQQPAKCIYDFIRGLSPVPVAWSVLMPNNLSMKIFRAAKTNETCNGAEPGTLRTDRARLFVATADNWLELLEVQLAGKKRMEVRQFLNGAKDIENQSLV